MMRLWLTSTFVLTAIFALALSALRLMPQPSIIQMNLSACAIPCWQGVQPGVTGAQAAVDHLSALNRFAAFEAPCEAARSSCQRYTWVPPGDQILYTQIEIDSGQVGSVLAYNPGFSLGEAIVALQALNVDLDGADPNFIENNQFYTQIMFADSHVVMETFAPCGATYLDLLRAPIRTLEIDAPQLNNHYVPITSFGEMRRLFYTDCSPALQ